MKQAARLSLEDARIARRSPDKATAPGRPSTGAACSVPPSGCRENRGGTMRQRGTRAGVRRRSTAARKSLDNQRRPKRRTAVKLHRSDVVDFVNQHAAQIAAPDIAVLLTDGAMLRDKAAAIRGSRFQSFRRQVNDAIDCLDDYMAGRCVQIPYYTVAILATALFYFRQPVDAVPDFLPELGAVDDALVMAVATDIASQGLRRYRTWRSTSRDSEETEADRQRKPGRRTRSRAGS